MSIKGKMGLGIGLLLACLVPVLAGCGSGSDATAGSGGAAISPVKVARCEAGAHVPGAQAMWRQGPRPATVLGCSADRVDAGALIVGYPIPEGGSCVSAYSARLRQAFGELCEPPGSAWLSQCEGPGCVHYFSHTRNATVLDGPVERATAGIRILVGHEVLLEGVMHADIQGRRLRRIGAEEPFDFFAAYIPRCVEPGKVKVELIDEKGAIIGTADKWDVAVPPCPRAR
ncbi:MAG TPA: hypothetical protein VFK14_06205 [Solirubrobacterales bacterium]|nr:hypothetical protein [Solirubrobacterales bacterium]